MVEARTGDRPRAVDDRRREFRPTDIDGQHARHTPTIDVHLLGGGDSH